MDTLQTFTLNDLAQFTKEGAYSNNASPDFHLFYVGRDNVHEILKYILSRVSTSLYLNMFGYDDEELNNILMDKVADPNILVMITLDKSQSGGIHEKRLLDSDEANNPTLFNTHFTLGESLTHQISHTKGFVADGKVGAEGSTNWSNSGEGTFINTSMGEFKINSLPEEIGFRAQNNTQSVFIDQDTITRFTTELITEHMIATKQQKESENA